MLAKTIATGLVGSVLLASAAFAQGTATTSERADTASAAASPSSFQGDWRASKVVGLNVYNDNNENVGSINDLLMDKGGNIKAAVLSVGGFLGVGARLVAVPYEKLKFSTQPVSYVGASNAPNTGSRPSSTTTTGSAATGSSSSSSPSTGASRANLWYPDHAVFNATKDDLKSMPEFKYSE